MKAINIHSFGLHTGGGGVIGGWLPLAGRSPWTRSFALVVTMRRVEAAVVNMNLVPAAFELCLTIIKICIFVLAGDDGLAGNVASIYSIESREFMANWDKHI